MGLSCEPVIGMIPFERQRCQYMNFCKSFIFSHMRITIKQLRSIIRESLNEMKRPESFGRDVSPHWSEIHDAFLRLRDENGEVEEHVLAKELGLDSPHDINYRGTGLRRDFYTGVVTELL